MACAKHPWKFGEPVPVGSAQRGVDDDEAKQVAALLRQKLSWQREARPCSVESFADENAIFGTERSEPSVAAG